jgi:hypothetical protein
MLDALFEQVSGRFLIEGDPQIDVFGYAGRLEGRNNPAMQSVKDVGPLPVGFYVVTPPQTHPRLGPLAFRLYPDGNSPMFGRGGFWIHGDNRRHDASCGCIVLDRATRVILADRKVTGLWVVRSNLSATEKLRRAAA